MTNTSTAAQTGTTPSATDKQGKPNKKAPTYKNTSDNPVQAAAAAAHDHVHSALETARDTGQEALNKAHQAGQQLYDGGSDMMRSAHSGFDQAVRRNPTAAVLGAIGLGVLIGFAFKQRS